MIAVKCNSFLFLSISSLFGQELYPRQFFNAYKILPNLWNLRLVINLVFWLLVSNLLPSIWVTISVLPTYIGASSFFSSKLIDVTSSVTWKKLKLSNCFNFRCSRLDRLICLMKGDKSNTLGKHFSSYYRLGGLA